MLSIIGVELMTTWQKIGKVNNDELLEGWESSCPGTPGPGVLVPSPTVQGWLHRGPPQAQTQLSWVSGGGMSISVCPPSRHILCAQCGERALSVHLWVMLQRHRGTVCSASSSTSLKSYPPPTWAGALKAGWVLRDSTGERRTPSLWWLGWRLRWTIRERRGLYGTNETFIWFQIKKLQNYLSKRITEESVETGGVSSAWVRTEAKPINTLCRIKMCSRSKKTK